MNKKFMTIGLLAFVALFAVGAHVAHATQGTVTSMTLSTTPPTLFVIDTSNEDENTNLYLPPASENDGLTYIYKIVGDQNNIDILIHATGDDTIDNGLNSDFSGVIDLSVYARHCPFITLVADASHNTWLITSKGNTGY